MRIEINSTIKLEDIPFKLPNKWTWYKWGDLITEYQQGLIRSNRELTDTGILYLKMNNLDNSGSYDLNKMEYTIVSPNELERYKLYTGDFLLNVRNSKELVGKTCVIRNHNFDMVFNHMLVRIKHHEGISSSYINALLKIPVMRKFIERCKSGTTTVIALYQRDIFEIPIPLPDKLTHDSIVVFVESILSKIELNNRINTELEQMAKTIYDYWFVQFDFPISAEYAASVGQPELEGKPYKSSGGKMVWSDELKRAVPEGWEVKSLGDLFYISLGGTPSTKEKKYWEKGTIPWLNSGEIANFPIIESELKITEAAIKSSATELLPKGSVMLSITRHLRPSILGIDACANQSVVGIKGKGDIKCYFLYPYLQNEIPRLMAMRSGAQQPHINKEIVAESNILLPNVESQILKAYNIQVGAVYDLIINNAKENQKLTELRDWLLPMLMNGQVRVGDVEQTELLIAAEPQMKYGK
jgi:type I restriction enzyme S subunit